MTSGARRFVLVSSPLAADRGTSMAGASLRVAELIVERAAARVHKEQGERAPVLAAVRVGQAVDAGLEGSLPDLLAVQIAAGGPVTLSNPEAVVTPLTLRKAVKRTLRAAEHAVSGRIYEVDMGTRSGSWIWSPRRPGARAGGGPDPLHGRATWISLGRSNRARTRNCEGGFARLRGTGVLGPVRARRPARTSAELYAAARKNRDPRVRQQLARLARA